jgi:hypothetical protein
MDDVRSFASGCSHNSSSIRAAGHIVTHRLDGIIARWWLPARSSWSDKNAIGHFCDHSRLAWQSVLGPGRTLERTREGSSPREGSPASQGYSSPELAQSEGWSAILRWHSTDEIQAGALYSSQVFRHRVRCFQFSETSTRELSQQRPAFLSHDVGNKPLCGTSRPIS